MIERILIVLLFAAVPGALAQSPPLCPWLNSGTAAKILGADVVTIAHSDSNWSGSCRFTAITDSTRTIEIVVGARDSQRCGGNARFTPLTGIGNEVKLCSYRDTNGLNIEAVAGRVRNAWFAVALAMPSADPRPPKSQTDPPVPSAIELLGEQVAGNLY